MPKKQQQSPRMKLAQKIAGKAKQGGQQRLQQKIQRIKQFQRTPAGRRRGRQEAAWLRRKQAQASRPSGPPAEQWGIQYTPEEGAAYAAWKEGGSVGPMPSMVGRPLTAAELNSQTSGNAIKAGGGPLTGGTRRMIKRKRY